MNIQKRLSFYDNELALPGALPVNKYATSTSLKAVSSFTKFLPRLALMQGLSKAVQARKAQAGDLVLIKNKDEIHNFGVEVDLWVLSWRHLAVTQDGDDYYNFYNPESPEYQEIQENQANKVDGNFWGPQFLVWIPQHGFAQLHMNSPTLRNCAEEVTAYLESKTTIKSDLIQGKKFSWYGIQAHTCTAMLDKPDPDEVLMQVGKFVNPAESEIERSDDAEAGREV